MVLAAGEDATIRTDQLSLFLKFEKHMENKERTYTRELQSSFQHHDLFRGHSSGPPPTMPGDPTSPCLHL